MNIKQWIWDTQNHAGMAVKEIKIKIKMFIAVYLSEGNANYIGSRCTTFGSSGTILSQFISTRGFKETHRGIWSGFGEWTENRTKTVDIHGIAASDL